MDRKICTEDDPWKEGDGRSVHPSAVLIGSEDNGLSGGGSYERYECPICKLRFWVTLAD